MNSIIKYKFIHAFRKFVPSCLRRTIRRHLQLTEYEEYQARLNNPYADDPPEYIFPQSKYMVGIVIEKYHYHKYNIAACRELGISYKLLDIFENNWLDLFTHSNCDAFLIWPSPNLSIWKEVFDTRCRILEEELGYILYPSFKEIWLYENKIRQRDWLMAHNIPHPKTWVFYDEAEAIDFVKNVPLPIIGKIATGASASGVWIFRRRSEALSFVRKSFSQGVVGRRSNPLDRQWRVVYLQEYLADVKEWRMVRIGDSYFGHPKGRRGDFHSGSGVVIWDAPEKRHLDFLRHLTEIGGFTSINVDLFETRDGRLLVNELHTVFGASYSVDQLRVNGISGRFVFDSQKGEWRFQPGDYARNACANARLEYLINHILPNKDIKSKE